MIAFSIGSIHIHWYGIFYAVSFLLGFLYIKYIISSKTYFNIIHKKEFLDDIFIYSVLGVLFGGRLGYVFFYNFNYFLHAPIKIFYIWEGGMAFAGAFIGVGIALYLLARKYKISYFKITDLIVSILPFGLGIGRIGNYLNGELFGKSCPDYLIGTFLCKNYNVDGITSLHISNQLLESFFEGWFLLIIFQYLVWKKDILNNKGFLTIFFILYYSTIRFSLEFVRWHPKDYILYFGLSISQYLISIFFILGCYLLYRKIFKKL